MQNTASRTVFVIQLCASAALFGCVDSAESAPQSSSETASSEGPAEPAPAPSPSTDVPGCMQCIQSSAGCGAEHQACSEMESCAPFFECGLAKSCFVPGEDPTACITPCALENGITSPDHPVVAAFVPLLECTSAKCARECTPR